jgi:hypothetical protein
MESFAKNGRRTRIWPILILWAAFAAGLLVQTISPQLKVKNNKFVIPAALMSGTSEIRPDELIVQERTMQAISGILTLGSALGLAFHYRQVLFVRNMLKGEQK